MHILKGYLAAFVVAVCFSFGLTFLPKHNFTVGWVIPTESRVVSTNMLERSMRVLSTVRIQGRIEQIERSSEGIAVQVAIDQNNLNTASLEDAYIIIYQLIGRANVPVVRVNFINLQANSNIGSVLAQNANLTNPLPKSDEIVDYVKQHFSVQYNK